MLTGPVTILAWSFVRDDQPRRETANQVALALADEIADLWVNPDCGLKTRDYEETKQSLRHLVDATKAIRASL